MKIKIGKRKYDCTVGSCTTQAGKQVVRVTSAEAPVARNGFMIYSDDESIELDMSDYTYLYREDGDVKEYTTEAEEILETESYITGLPTNPITQAFANVNRRITEITPYEGTKKAYYGEVEKVFYGVPNGVLTVHFDGEYEVQRIEDRVVVKFDRLEETKDITITVQ